MSHLATLLDQPAMGPEWKSWLTYELALRGVQLDTDGTLEERGTLIGFFRFLEAEECEALLRAANVEVRAHDCPWGGPVRGALGWDSAGSVEDLLRSFLPALIRLSRGPLVRTEDGAHYEPLRRMAFSLDNLTGKFGFEDGDAFLGGRSGLLTGAASGTSRSGSGLRPGRCQRTRKDSFRHPVSYKSSDTFFGHR